MENIIKQYENYLITEEKSAATIQKYIRDVSVFVKWLNGREMSKEITMEYKQLLAEQYTVATVNSIISSLNTFFVWLGIPECKVKSIRTQKSVYTVPNRDLTMQEYKRLVKTAYATGRRRLCLLIQTIAATGIRISELENITVDAINKGTTTINCKGKIRTILIPSKLCRMLLEYTNEKGIEDGSIFVTRNGKPIDRSNIWGEMKRLCKKACVMASKVFPHNLRHLFGKTYYTMYQDISRLADLLGHSNIDTTRIYTLESGEIHRKRIQNLGLIIDFISQNTT